MAKRNISFGQALQWLETKKKEMINDDRLMSAYKRSVYEMKEYSDRIEEADKEIEKYENSINMIKNGIIAMRGNKDLCDSMVAEMNNKVEKLDEWVSTKHSCVNEYMNALRLVENYDRDTEKELFFFWDMLHDLLPELTPAWIDFQHEHRDFYYKNHINV